MTSTSSIIADSLKEAIDLSNTTYKYPDIYSRKSKYCLKEANEMCTGLPGIFRIGCCKPSNVKILKNVMFKNNKFIMFEGAKHLDNKSCDSEYFDLKPLPALQTVHYRKIFSFSLPLAVQRIPFPTELCSKMFEGTLHVMGVATVHNLFHASMSPSLT